jgi:hypothetical protein
MPHARGLLTFRSFIVEICQVLREAGIRAFLATGPSRLEISGSPHIPQVGGLFVPWGLLLNEINAIFAVSP